ncbi:hypothetical protein BHE74_00042403 [Ensete ventricosum]|nr:hypothetical protein BHE74_00042403 [Ensete ventricosum]
MIGVLRFFCLEGDLRLVGFVGAFLHDSPCVGLPSRCAGPSGCQAPNDDVDLLLDGPLRSGGQVSGPMDVVLEVPMVNKLLYLIAEQAVQKVEGSKESVVGASRVLEVLEASLALVAELVV